MVKPSAGSTKRAAKWVKAPVTGNSVAISPSATIIEYTIDAIRQ